MELDIEQSMPCFHIEACFLRLLVLWSSNCNWSFDAKFLKFLMLIDLFITNMGL